ncbi:hypothetical protein H2201_006607 [Coniosporium apollinis]|uniref:Uncharacterized protein n=1 Tax=Coniosporium apollinis TaxID=61459 RepID=A0ABQ9NLF2_9PEZI|nr:hypothetical protein H2201_006607 [Coniosporium apollinis]
MAYSSSRTWISHGAREAERFDAFQTAARRDHFKNSSPFIPKDIVTWVTHRKEMQDAHVRRERRLIELVEQERKARQTQPPPRPALNGKLLSACQGAVLSQYTIWCRNWDVPWKPHAPWPGYKERQWEGDDRNHTNVGRFLPLPRLPGNPTVTFSHIPAIEIFPFDEVRRIPTMEDIFLPVDEIEDEVVPNLLNKDLLDELDPHDIF